MVTKQPRNKAGFWDRLDGPPDGFPVGVAIGLVISGAALGYLAHTIHLFGW